MFPQGSFDQVNFVEGVSESFFKNILSDCPRKIMKNLWQKLHSECGAQVTRELRQLMMARNGQPFTTLQRVFQDGEKNGRTYSPEMKNNMLFPSLMQQHFQNQGGTVIIDEGQGNKSSISNAVKMGGIHGLMKILMNSIGKYPISSFWRGQDYTLKRELNVLKTLDEVKVKKNREILHPMVLKNICVFLNPKTIINASTTCKNWNQVLSLNKFWKILYLNHCEKIRKAEIRSYKDSSVRKQVRIMYNKFKNAETLHMGYVNWKVRYAMLHKGVHFGPKRGLCLNHKYLKKKENVFLPYFALHSLSSIARYDVKFALQIITNEDYMGTIMKYFYFGFTWLENYAAAKFFSRIADHVAKDSRIWGICTQPKVVSLMLFLLDHCEDIVFREFIQFPEHRDQHVEEIVCEIESWDGEPAWSENDREKKCIWRAEQTMSLYADHPRDFLQTLWLHDKTFCVDLCEKYDVFSIIFKHLMKKHSGAAPESSPANILVFFRDLMAVDVARGCLLKNPKMCSLMIHTMMRSLGNAAMDNTAVNVIGFMCYNPGIFGMMLELGYVEKIESILRFKWKYRTEMMKVISAHSSSFKKEEEVGHLQRLYYMRIEATIKDIQEKCSLSLEEKERSGELAKSSRDKGVSIWSKNVTWRNGQVGEVDPAGIPHEKTIKKTVELFKIALELCPQPEPGGIELKKPLRGYEHMRLQLCSQISNFYYQLKDYKNCVKYSIIGSHCYWGDDISEYTMMAYYSRVKARYLNPGFSRFNYVDNYADIKACLRAPKEYLTTESRFELKRRFLKKVKDDIESKVNWITVLQRRWGVRMLSLRDGNDVKVKDIEEFVASLRSGFMPPVMAVREKVFDHKYIIVEKKKKKNCANCGEKAEKKCSRCNKVYYCSKDCQIKHWKGGHKAECKKMKAEN